MGCDIHMHVEMLTRKSENWSQWEVIENRVILKEYNKDTAANIGWGDGRNYSAFSMLANVRNGSSFYDMGDKIKPIDLPRGIPDDSSEKVENEFNSWGEDAHSASWFGLRELVELEEKGYWDNTREVRGVVDIREMDDYWKEIILEQNGKELTLKRAPNEWAGSIYSPSSPNTIYNIKFNKTYREDCGWLLPTINKLKELASSYEISYLNPVFPDYKHTLESTYEDLQKSKCEAFRIVFWFDN